MPFLKKNCVKLAISALLLGGAVLFIVLLAQYKASYHDFANQFDPSRSGADPKYAASYLYSYIAALTAFLLCAAFAVMSMFEKTKRFGKWTMCATGAACVVFMAVAITGALGSKASEYGKEVGDGEYDAVIEQMVTAGVAAEVRPQVEASVAQAVSEQTGGAVSPAEVPTNPATAASYETAFAEAYANQMASAEIQGMIASLADEKITYAKENAKYQSVSRTMTLISQLIIFGLLPLAYGVKKALEKGTDN